MFCQQYLGELSLVDSDPFLKYLPSQTAAAAYMLANSTITGASWVCFIQLQTAFKLWLKMWLACAAAQVPGGEDGLHPGGPEAMCGRSSPDVPECTAACAAVCQGEVQDFQVRINATRII